MIQPVQKPIWHYQIVSALAEQKIACHFFLSNGFSLLLFDDHALVIHLVDLDNNFAPTELLALQHEYQQNGLKLIHLWEDVWQSRQQQVCFRIFSILRLNKRIHGRKTNVIKLDKLNAATFLNDNHLQGYVSSRYKLGLAENQKLVAVATFSALRKMNYEPNYKSAELIRFAVKAGYSVSGGLSKLIRYFYQEYQPNDLMSYADRDWSAGEVYIKLGFKSTAQLDAQKFGLDESGHRSLINNDSIHYNQTVFNTGSIKFILKF